MYRMMVFAVAALSGLAAPAAAQDAARPLCLAETNQALRRAGIAESQVRSINMFTLPSEGLTRLDLQAWVGLTSCTGEVVVSMTTNDCRVVTIHATGNCRLPVPR